LKGLFAQKTPEKNKQRLAGLLPGASWRAFLTLNVNKTPDALPLVSGRIPLRGTSLASLGPIRPVTSETLKIKTRKTNPGLQPSLPTS
jgi:hypothetical protein